MASSGSGTPPIIIFRNAIRDSEQLSSRAKLVAFVLSTYMDAEELTCYPAVATIARGAGYSKRRPAQRGLDELEEAGVLDREVGGGRNTSHYQGVLPYKWQQVRDKQQVSSRQQDGVPNESQPLLPDGQHVPLPEAEHEHDIEQVTEQPQEQTDDFGFAISQEEKDDDFDLAPGFGATTSQTDVEEEDWYFDALEVGEVFEHSGLDRHRAEQTELFVKLPNEGRRRRAKNLGTGDTVTFMPPKHIREAEAALEPQEPSF